MADELEVKFTVTRKASTDHNGEDVVLAEPTSVMSSEHRERFLAYAVATYGLDEEGNPRSVEGIIGALVAGLVAGTIGNIERWEREAAAQAAREAVAPLAVTVT